MRREAKTQKVIAQKRNNLSRLTDCSERIIQGFTTVVKELQEVNEEIEKEQSEIEESVSSLLETKNGLDETKQKNEKLIRNFSKLFEV